MQVPYSSNSEYGQANITLKNAINGNVLPNADFVIRKGMNTTTGAIFKSVQSDLYGKINLDKISPGNYTGVIEETGYIKTIFNFTIIGDEIRTYEVHVSPVISKDEM